MRFRIPRRWVIFGLVMLLTGGVSLFMLRNHPVYQWLVHYFYYTIISHVYISVFPHEPVLIYYGKLYNHLLLAVFGGIATCIAGFIDYETLTPALRFQPIRKLYYGKRFYMKAVDFFTRAPFLIIWVAAFTPIPFYPIKLLSIAEGYSQGRYLLALFTARTPRYYLFALTGKALNIPNWMLLAAFVLMFVWGSWKKVSSGIRKLLEKIKQKP